MDITVYVECWPIFHILINRKWKYAFDFYSFHTVFPKSPMFQWRIQIPVRIKQDPECSVVLNKIISAGTLCPFSTKIMSPTLSSELAIDTCPLLVNLQYLDEFQGNLLRSIDKFSIWLDLWYSLINMRQFQILFNWPKTWPRIVC